MKKKNNSSSGNGIFCATCRGDPKTKSLAFVRFGTDAFIWMCRECRKELKDKIEASKQASKRLTYKLPKH